MSRAKGQFIEKPVLAADGVAGAMWRTAIDIGALVGCARGPGGEALARPGCGDILILGDVTLDRLDQARRVGFRFGVEAAITPFWLARLLQFIARPKALMGWCLSAETYRKLPINQTLLRQLPADVVISRDSRLDLDLLLTEAIANTLDHGAPPSDSEVPPSFGLFISAHDEGLELSIVQAGDGPSDPDGLLGRMHGGVPALDGEGGRGLFLISEMARFAWFEEEGRCLRFVMAT